MVLQEVTFPSIIDKNMKTELNWEDKKYELINCKYTFSDQDSDYKNKRIYYFYSIIRSYEKLTSNQTESSCNKN